MLAVCKVPQGGKNSCSIYLQAEESKNKGDMKIISCEPIINYDIFGIFSLVTEKTFKNDRLFE